MTRETVVVVLALKPHSSTFGADVRQTERWTDRWGAGAVHDSDS